MKYLLLLCLVGCLPTGAQATQKEVQSLEYYRDERTNLCFVRNTVTNSNGFTDNIYTHVPCTSEVLKLIPQPTTK